MKYAFLVSLFAAGTLLADAKQVDEFQWEGVQRVVAIGDIHGDYDNYMAALQAAGVVDKRGKWDGGETHLVQTGDIPDRGPDTIRIIEHMQQLAKQASRKGGRVHNLIGNHEAMNVYGDLRYVHEGEYEAFVTRSSERLRDRYFEVYMQRLQEQDPERFAALPEDFRSQWNREFPLGWLEHRQAWDPAWNAAAPYAKWVFDNKVAIRINDSVFVHGGISGFYCQNTLDSLTEKVVSRLREFDPQNMGVLNDEFGPLWYRGLSGSAPEALPETVDAILAQRGARRIVVGHTPTSGVVWPRYDGKVVMIDTGLSGAYGGHIGYLEITPEGAFAGYRDGKLPLPASDADTVAYLEQVISMHPQNPYLRKQLDRLTAPPGPQPETPEAAAEEGAGQAVEGTADEAADQPAEAKPEIPVCGITP